MRFGSLFWIGALAGLAAGLSYATHRRLEDGRRASAGPAEPLQRWEGEGGTVRGSVTEAALAAPPGGEVPG
jgi:hypothetical protein